MRQRSVTPQGLRAEQAAIDIAAFGPSTPPPYAAGYSARSVTPLREAQATGRERLRDRLLKGGSKAQQTPFHGENAVHRNHTPPRGAQHTGTCRVLCYGDSNTAGYNPGTPLHTPYADQLSEGLAQHGLEVAMTCCGLSGKTAQEMLQAAESPAVPDNFGRMGKGLIRILQDEGPHDLVILMAGTNDLGSHVPVELIVQRVQALQRMCVERGVPTVIMGPPTTPQLARSKMQLSSMLSNWARSAPGVAAYFDAEELVPRQPQFWAADGLHFSPQGSAELGRRLAPLVRPLLMRGTSLAQGAGTPRQQAADGALTPGRYPLGGGSARAPLGGSARAPLGGSARAPVAVAPPAQDGGQWAYGRSVQAPVSARNDPSSTPRPWALSPPPQLPGGAFSTPRNDGVEGQVGAYNTPTSCPSSPFKGMDVLSSEIGTASAYQVGDQVGVWSKSSQAWCPGRVMAVSKQVLAGVEVDGMITTKIRLPNGSFASKVLPAGHLALRRRSKVGSDSFAYEVPYDFEQ